MPPRRCERIASAARLKGAAILLKHARFSATAADSGFRQRTYFAYYFLPYAIAIAEKYGRLRIYMRDADALLPSAGPGVTCRLPSRRGLLRQPSGCPIFITPPRANTFLDDAAPRHSGAAEEDGFRRYMIFLMLFLMMRSLRALPAPMAASYHAARLPRALAVGHDQELFPFLPLLPDGRFTWSGPIFELPRQGPHDGCHRRYLNADADDTRMG